MRIVPPQRSVDDRFRGYLPGKAEGGGIERQNRDRRHRSMQTSDGLPAVSIFSARNAA